MFPVAFVVGMRLWPWVDDLMERTHTLLTQTKLITNLIPSYSSRIIGSCSFVATSVITSCFAGLILTPPAMQIVIDPSYKTFIAAGAAYGAICWLLIQLGYLQQTRIYPKDS